MGAKFGGVWGSQSVLGAGYSVGCAVLTVHAHV